MVMLYNIRLQYIHTSLRSIQDGSKIEVCEFEISSFEVSRSHTFTMAGQNFDCAVGGLIIVFEV